jgi:predicted metal-dependent peptidase
MQIPKHVTDEKIYRRLVRARSLLTMDLPLFAFAVLQLRLEENYHVPTMATDGIRIMYNPDFVKQLNDSHCKAVIAHEGCHPLCLHHLRRGSRDPMIWNYAGDFVINLMLKDAGLNLPEGALIDEKYRNHTTEMVYNDLFKQAENLKQYLKNKYGAEGNEGKPSEDFPGASIDDTGGMGTVVDAGTASGKKFAEVKGEESQRWKILQKQASAHAKAMGYDKGNILRTIDAEASKKIPWEIYLKNWFEQVVKNDYSWEQPNRKFAYYGYYLPSLYGREIGNVFVFNDVSGSVSEKELAEYADKISQIFETFADVTVHVGYCDTAVRGEMQTFTKFDLPVRFEARGGGGTSYAPAFQYIYDNMPDINCLIYFTDMYCDDYPKQHPEFPVLWLNSGPAVLPYGHPPFGEVINLREV